MWSSFIDLLRTCTAQATMAVAVILSLSCVNAAQAQSPAPRLFEVRVITRDMAFTNIELGGKVWVGNPPNDGQFFTAPHTFQPPAGDAYFYFAQPTAVSPAGCIYAPEVGMMTFHVDRDVTLPVFFQCPEDNTSGPCAKAPESSQALGQLVNARLNQYQTALQSYGPKDFRTAQARHEFICYLREQTNRAKQRR
jgi:hypothetical protein